MFYDDPNFEIMQLLRQILSELQDIAASCSVIDMHTGEISSISNAVDEIKENM